jgi:hypothetical protein
MSKNNETSAVEKSWEFLDNISAKVEKNFSREDKKTLLDLGMNLLRVGVQYIHVIIVGQNAAVIAAEEKRKQREKETLEAIANVKSGKYK